MNFFSLPILKCCFVVLLPTCLEMVFVEILLTYFELLVLWNATHKFWGVGLLNCYKRGLNSLFVALLQIFLVFCWTLTPRFEVLFCWTLSYRFWSVGLFFCYPQKCCLLNYYPHIWMCWFAGLLPTCFEMLVCWTDNHMLWSVSLLNSFRCLWRLLNTTVRCLVYIMDKYSKKLNTHGVFVTIPLVYCRE
jgi:hypothetical protein